MGIWQKLSGFVSVGSGLVSMFANRLPEDYQDFGLYCGLAILLLSSCTFLIIVWRDWHAARRARTPELKPVPSSKVEDAEKDPQTWRTDQAMEYVADTLGLTSEDDIDRKYRNPARMITRQAIAVNIQVWGKRISRDGPELVRREIPARQWRNRELLIWACLPYTREPQTRSTIDSPETYQFTDLHVNEAEVKAINWQAKDT